MATDKQINWANKIKASKIGELQNLHDKLITGVVYLGTKIGPENEALLAQMGIQFLQGLIEKYTAITDPIWWINHKEEKLGKVEWAEFDARRRAFVAAHKLPLTQP